MITKSKHPIARALDRFLTRPILRRAVLVTAAATSASPSVFHSRATAQHAVVYAGHLTIFEVWTHAAARLLAC